MDQKQHNSSFLADLSEAFSGEALYNKNGNLYVQRCMAYSVLGLALISGWFELQFSLLAAAFGLYLLVYPHISLAAGFLLRTYMRRSIVNPALMLLDALQLGLAMGLSGFAMVPALVSVCLLVFYILLRRTFWSILPCLALLLVGCSSAFWLRIPINLDTPPLVTLLCMAGLAMQLAFNAVLLRRQSQSLQALSVELQTAQGLHENLARDLTRYLSPQVWQQLFKKNNTASSALKTQRKKLTVFFSDIKGFTDLSEEMEPEDLTDILNGYLSDMTAIALDHGGTIDKFIGDSIMILFGDSQSRGASHDAIAAVSMAIEMRKHMRTLRQRWQAKGIHKRLEIRMGINTGYCTVGTFGADSRMDYTVIGREVNLASRLESAAGADEILISGETYTLIKDKIMGRDKGQIQVKGFSRPVSIYQVVDYRCDLGPARSYLAHELPGFSMQLDTANLGLEDIDKVVRALGEALEQLQE